MKKSRLLGIVCVCLTTLTFNAKATIISYNADDYALHTTANNLLPGIALSVVSPNPIITGDTIIGTKTNTGTIQNDHAFGYTQTNGNIFTAYSNYSASIHSRVLKIELDSNTNYFGLLFDNGGRSFIGQLTAFDSSGNVLAEVLTEIPPGYTSSINPTWASISLATNDISYVFANAYGGTVASVDIIEFNAVPVPTPSIIWLFGSGFLVLIGLARRMKA